MTEKLILLIFIFSVHIPCAADKIANVESGRNESYVGLIQPTQMEINVAQQLKIVANMSCKDEVWPNYQLGKFPYYLGHQTFDGKSLSADHFFKIDFNSQYNRLQNVPESIVTEKGMRSATNFFVWWGRKSVYDQAKGMCFNLRDQIAAPKPVLPPNAPSCMKEYVKKYGWPDAGTPQAGADWVGHIPVHEAFHAFDQSKYTGWEKIEGLENRQLLENPKLDQGLSFQRAHIIYLLKEALIAQPHSPIRTHFLEMAKAWYLDAIKKHESHMSLLSPIDRIEGTAEYASIVAGILARNGCKLSPDLMHRAIIKTIKPVEVIFGLPEQSYALGPLSGLLMDEMGIKDWKKQVMKGETPLEALMKSVPNPGKEVRPIPLKPIKIARDRQRQWTSCVLRTQARQSPGKTSANKQNPIRQ